MASVQLPQRIESANRAAAPGRCTQDNKLSLFVSGAKNYAFYMGERTEAFSQCANIQMLRSIEIDAEARLKNGDWHSHVKVPAVCRLLLQPLQLH